MKHFFKTPFFLGPVFFIIQFFLIMVINPEKNFWEGYLKLASHWDSSWYEAIATHGYLNNNGPMNTGILSSNVVFFPGYPYLARILILCFGINAKVALLIVSQSSAFIFWCLFFKIIKRTSFVKQIFAGILIVVFPTSWFLFMGYSESLFILMCCLMVWFATEKKYFPSGISGAAMTATRIMGVPLLIAPLIASCFQKINIRYGTIIVLGSLGFIGFLIYCHIQFNWWDLYFEMERVGWHATANPYFLFKLPTWFPPPFSGYSIVSTPPLPVWYESIFILPIFKLAAYNISELLVPIMMWLFLFSTIFVLKNKKNWNQKSLMWFFSAGLLLLGSCLSTFNRDYESMSRLLLPVWIVFIIADVLHPGHIFFLRFLKDASFKVFIGFIILISAGMWLQLLTRYFLGWWVA